MMKAQQNDVEFAGAAQSANSTKTIVSLKASEGGRND